MGNPFTLLTRPGVYIPNKVAQIAKWQEKVVIVAERVDFVDTINRLVDNA